jgi:tetratricopeptide (TPR) repeat protein
MMLQRTTALLLSILLAPAVMAGGITATEEAVARAERAHADGDFFAASAAYRDALGTALALGPGERGALLGEVELAILRLARLSEETGDYPSLEEALAPWRVPLPVAGPDSSRPTPELTAARNAIAARARFLHGMARLETGGTPAEAEADWRPLGFLLEWRVIGPFDNERGQSFLEELPPEREIRLDAEYDGKKRPVRWVELPVRPPAGEVRLDEILEPNAEALAYAVAFIRAEKETEAALRFSTDEGYRAWLNGELVASADVRRTFGFDSDAVPVRIRPGWNRLLFKVAQSTGPWRFAARLTARSGEPLEGIAEGLPPPGVLETAEEAPAGPAAGASTTTPPSDPATPPAAPPPATLPRGAEALLEARIEKEPADARAHHVLGSILLERKAHDENEHPDTEHILRAIQIDPAPVAHHLALARSRQRETTIGAEKEENLLRRALEDASARGSALADTRLAEHYRTSFDNHSRALELIDAALRRNPALERAIRLRGEIEERLGFPRAGELAREAVWALPAKTVSSHLERAGALIQKGLAAEAEETLLKALGRNGRNHAARLGLARLLVSTGRTDAAAEIIRTGSTLDPMDTYWHERLADILEGADRIEEAAASIDAALAIRPEDHDLMVRRAKLLVRLGRKDAALASLDRALELQPNLPDAREYADFLRAATSGFEDEFRRDVTAVIKSAFERKDPNDQGDPARVLLRVDAVKVNQDGTTKEFVQEVIQVLNDRGLRIYDGYETGYAAGEQVVEFKKARVHRPDGTSADAKLSRHGGLREGRSLFRRASIDLPPVSAGDVIEVELVREDIAQSFFGDYFGRREIFQDDVPIGEKVFILRVPAGRKFHVHARNMDIEPRVEEDAKAGTVTTTWVKKDIPKLEPEPAMPSAVEVSPAIEVSTFATWDAFGKWYWNLIKKQFEVSPEISKKVRELVSGADTDLAKIRAIYNFIVTDIRYNAWEFGVHGFKPYNASAIFARRFGDCKDKATLMTVMLSEAGIRSNPVLIRAESSRWREDLALPLIEHFNHCITYVPPGNGHGEMYLDGTARFHAFEELPSMDRGARVLVVEEGGGKLHDVPWNGPEDLSITEEATVRLQSDLGAEVQLRSELRGDYAVYCREWFEIPTERKTQLERILGRRHAGAEVREEEFSNLLDLDQPVAFSVTLDVPGFIVEAPEGLALKPLDDFFETAKGLAGLGSLEKRAQDIVLSNPRRAALKAVFVLPEGFRVKSFPRSAEIESRFGRLRVDYREDGPGRLAMSRVIEITSPRVPVSDYAELREFAASVERLDQERILLERS